MGGRRRLAGKLCYCFPNAFQSLSCRSRQQAAAASSQPELRCSMGFLEGLFEAAMDFAGIIGVVLLLGAIVFGVAFVGMMTFAGVGMTWIILTEDKEDKLVPWRVVL